MLNYPNVIKRKYTTDTVRSSSFDLYLDNDSEILRQSKLSQFHFVNFPFIYTYNNIPAAPVYRSQLIRNSRACG